MNYSTRVALGVKDSHLELDEKHFAEPIEDQGDRIVVHLVQSYPLSCPHCGQPMLKNGFKTVNALGPSLHYKPTIWSIRKQKYLCRPSDDCPTTVTQLATVTDIDYRNHIAWAIKQRAMMLLTTNQSQKDLARTLGVSDWTVRRVITNLDRSFKPNYRWLPRHLAFDDFKSGKMAPSGMSMILMDIETHRTLDIIWRALKHFWKLILTSAGKLRYDNYWC